MGFLTLHSATFFPITPVYRKEEETLALRPGWRSFRGIGLYTPAGESGETVATASEKALKRGGGVVVSSNTQATDRKCQRCS